MAVTLVAPQVGCYELGSKKEPLPLYKKCIYLVVIFFHTYLCINMGRTSGKMGSQGETRY